VIAVTGKVIDAQIGVRKRLAQQILQFLNGHSHECAVSLAAGDTKTVAFLRPSGTHDDHESFGCA
jgi:hypothetical protein